MQITSIDNVYEDDGLVNLQMFLAGLNHQQNEPKDVLVAILPEYRDDGRLDRLDCVTVKAKNDPSGVSGGLSQLMQGAAEILLDEKTRRDAAYAKLNDQGDAGR